MRLWIVGAGGVGREALDIALVTGTTVEGFLDDARAGEHVRGLSVRAPRELSTGDGYIVAIGDPSTRLSIAARLDDAGGQAATLLHPSAIVGPETTVAAGCLVMGLAHISSSVRLGAHVQVQYGSTVGHDCVLDAGAIVLPGAHVAGAVHLGERAMVGSGAVILQGLSVGSDAVVGAGAVVTRDVEAGAVVVGSPARPVQRSSGPKVSGIAET